jgi:ubiquinone/menaquinone biosynthesis C-methylase UbiE
LSLFGRIYAAGYDRFAARIEQRGGQELRRRLVEDAPGTVLEVGAGTGLNFGQYRSAARVVGLEPDPDMRARAERAAREAAVTVELADGDAMALPFPDESFDTVVFSLVLCSVPDPTKALAEARRVLRTGGTLRFYEHVRSADPRLARWQDRLERPWRWIGRGCHANRDTLAMISSQFHVADVDRFDFAPAPAITRPHILGTAVIDGHSESERPPSS